MVRIADNTIDDAQVCFSVTGVPSVSKKTGAELIYPSPSLMKEMKLHGHRLDSWPVFQPLVEADKIINLPVAKDHSLSSLILGMKNWFGAIGGWRGALHSDIHINIVDLANFTIDPKPLVFYQANIRFPFLDILIEFYLSLYGLPCYSYL